MIKIQLEILATILTISGAVLTSINNYPLNLFVLNTGSIFWIIWAILDKRWSIGLVNMVLVLIYFLGYFGVIVNIH